MTVTVISLGYGVYAYPNLEGKWAVEKGGFCYAVCDSREEAVAAGRKAAKEVKAAEKS
jgi:hypothetical protein